MKKSILIILIIFIEGCTTSSKVNTVNIVSENNKDVFILSSLIQDYLITTNGRIFSFSDLIKIDSLSRISNNFEKIELTSHGSYIGVCYKFSKLRDERKIVLNDKERETINEYRWIAEKSNQFCDGEIRFDYGERGYRIIKIITNQHEN